MNPKTREDETIKEAAIAGLRCPIVVLGDPGLGKSILTQKLGREGYNRYVRAGTFVRSKSPSHFLPQAGGRLVIDGLDEIASTKVGGGVDAVLEQLSGIGNPPFVLSSREADWLGASARVRIEDDYGEVVSILHLEPFDRDDANSFLKAFFPDIDFDALLDHLTTRGLEGIYRNPLTLRMIGDVARAEISLPSTRAELLERACTIMLREENERHQSAQHALLAIEELLLAAGAICASLLLCDRSGVYSGPTSKTPDNFFHLSSAQSLPCAAAASDALKTRLFHADGEARFVSSHRVISEYLGARWLAACVEQGASERRVRSLITQSGGVPTSLRGLNAWLAHFSNILAPASIAADPYAVLRYGNGETLPLEQARILLRELAKLSGQDPYFRAGDWTRHPAAGLMRVELKDDIVSILSDDKTHTHLAFLLLEALSGSPLAPIIVLELDAVLLDPNRLYGARVRAADAIAANRPVKPIDGVIEELLKLGDSDSQRLAFEILTKAGPRATSITLIVETLLARAGLTVWSLASKQHSHVSFFHIPHDFLLTLDAPELVAFLDTITDYAAPLMRQDERLRTAPIFDVVRTAVLAILKSGTRVTPEQIWRWLSWMRDYPGNDTAAQSALRQQFERDICLRRGIQAAALSSAPEGELRYEAFHLRTVSPCLVPDGDDVIALIDLLCVQSSGVPDLQKLRDLVSLARGPAGLASGVRDAAIEVAGANQALIRELEEWSKPFVNPYEERQKGRLAKEDANRQEIYRKTREIHATHADSVRAGDYRWLQQIAKAYLGRFAEFSDSDKPEVRVQKFLGAELAEDAFIGFMAALHRTDLPSATEVAQLHARNRHWSVEIVLVCGVAEMVRRGIPLDTVSRPALDATYMAWRRQGESNTVSDIAISPALEAVVLAREAEAEAFFRTSIEPQLQARSEHVYDLYLLTHDRRWSALSGHLAVDWLIHFTALPLVVESELLDAAVHHGDRNDLARLVAVGTSRAHLTPDARLEWLATDFVINFDRARPLLADVARDQPNLLWQIRRRAAGGRHDAFVPLTISQRAFVVQAFGSSWPQVGWPEGVSGGDTNPWDASDFIEHAINSIAAEPVAEATEALQRLLLNAAPSYADTLRHALALQRRLLRDHNYTPALIEHVRSVASNALPETIDDMRAYFGDRIATVQARMHATNTDMWEAYWDGAKPRAENFCRNRLVEHISGQLPAVIRFEPEMHMPNQKRADIAAIRDAIGLPVEIKGQWHRQVWNAPMDQLAASYTRDWHAGGRGAYIVIWVGDVTRKRLPPHPDGLPVPTTAEALRAMLIDRIPQAMHDLIDVYVIDVTRMR